MANEQLNASIENLRKENLNNREKSNEIIIKEIEVIKKMLGAKL